MNPLPESAMSMFDAMIAAAPEVPDPDGQLLLGLQLIPHIVDGEMIAQRMSDGFVNATAMCQAVGKKLSHYLENKTTREFLEELASDAGIPASELVIVKKGGISAQQGTWVHPDVAINLGQWCSPKFAVAVSKWVRDWMSGNVSPGSSIPYHLRRYLANRGDIPHTHFSMLNELTFAIIAPLEAEGYQLPEHMVPDISEGKMFCAWLRRVKDVEPKDFPSYNHRYEDGRVVSARLYPNEYLAEFRKHLHGTWIPTKLVVYFQDRDPRALPFIQKSNLLKLAAPTDI